MERLRKKTVTVPLRLKPRDLVDTGALEAGTPAYGVAQQVIHAGYDSLSPKQRTLYDAVVVPALNKRGGELDVQRIIALNPD